MTAWRVWAALFPFDPISVLLRWLLRQEVLQGGALLPLVWADKLLPALGACEGVAENRVGTEIWGSNGSLQLRHQSFHFYRP